MSKPVTVRLRALDGVWEIPGIDRSMGVWLTDLVTEGDQWGPSKATFTIARDPIFVWPDLRAFNKIEIETDTRCFSGRISGTPAHSGDDMKVTVQAKGMQYHLDDDQFERIYLHDNLGDWRDLRSFLTTTINRVGMAAGQVTTDRGAITIGWAKGAQLGGATNAAVGVTIDLGPSGIAKRIVIDWAKIGATAAAGNFNLVIRGHDTEDGVNPASLENALAADVTTLGATGTTAFTFTTARRYVTVMLVFFNAGNLTLAEDNIFRITKALLFADTTYESGNASNLKAPVLCNDVLDRGTILLSSDRSQIDPGNTVTLNIPTIAPTQPQSPREYLAGGNAYHDYRLQVDVLDRLVFTPKPSAPIFEVGEWSALEGDPDDGDGEEVYDRVIVVAQTRDGMQLRVERTAAQQAGAPRRSLSTPAPTNASADVDASGWTGGTVTRDTTVFDSSPAAIKATALPVVGTFSGTFKKGLTYILTGVTRITGIVGGAGGSLVLTLGDASTGDVGRVLSYAVPQIGVFVSFQVSWTPRADSSNVTLTLTDDHFLGTSITAPIWVDTLTLAQAVPTIVDRQQFRRTKGLPISAPLPADGAVAQQLADVWLKDHKVIPFKGPFSVQEGAVRRVLTGETIPLELLPCSTMELMRFMDRNDPDTGGHGRDGRMVNAKWIWVEDRAEITIDNSRQSFEALLARLAVFTRS